MKLKLSNTTKIIPIRNEVAAMTVICNIQAMQNKVYGKCFDYSDFASNTLDELYNLQDQLITEYNDTFKQS